ncbi:hypothetical protein [Nocardioides sp. LHG3406-4]|uniref:hypothetical protein n=1 Tax=Nocardioides sp. LHG3406-4 TaxID=2804575 RepID=UPI003CFA48A0
MPTIVTVDAAWDTGVTLDATELRRVDTAMFLGDGTANGVRGGIVRHGDTSLAVTVNGSDQITVQPGAFVVPAATGLGVYRGALSAATAPTGIAARNGTNPRIDLVVIQVGTGSVATVKTIEGNPSATPSAPALPAQHIELGRLNVPKVGGGAVTVDSTWRAYATALGGTVPVETSARLPGSGNQKGQRAIALDTGRTWEWSGTSWTEVGGWVDVTNVNFPNLPLNGAGSAGRYVVHGRTVHARIRGAVAGAAGPIFMDLPVPASTAMGTGLATFLDGSAVALNNGTGTTAGIPTLVNANQVQFVSVASPGPLWAATVPHTWKNLDSITVNLTYERA